MGTSPAESAPLTTTNGAGSDTTPSNGTAPAPTVANGTAPAPTAATGAPRPPRTVRTDERDEPNGATRNGSVANVRRRTHRPSPSPLRPNPLRPTRPPPGPASGSDHGPPAAARDPRHQPGVLPTDATTTVEPEEPADPEKPARPRHPARTRGRDHRPRARPRRHRDAAGPDPRDPYQPDQHPDVGLLTADATSAVRARGAPRPTIRAKVPLAQKRPHPTRSGEGRPLPVYPVKVPSLRTTPRRAIRDRLPSDLDTGVGDREVGEVAATSCGGAAAARRG